MVLEVLDCDWNWYSPAVLVLSAVNVQQMLEYLSLEEQVVMEASEEPVMMMASSHLMMIQSEVELLLQVLLEVPEVPAVLPVVS